MPSLCGLKEDSLLRDTMCDQEVLIIHEEIVKCSKERLLLLNKLNIVHEHIRRAKCAGVGAWLRR